MLEQPITVGSLIMINSATMLPVVLLLGKGVWYLSKIVHQHEQVWEWFDGTRADRRTGHDRRHVPIGD